MKLTSAMAQALEVLDKQPARGSHQSTRASKTPWGRILFRTAFELHRHGLASSVDRLWTITDAGRAALGAHQEGRRSA